MELKGICIHTHNVPRLVDFYSKVFGVTAEGDDIHSVFDEVNLAIWNPGTIDIGNAGTKDRYFTLMFEVENVDSEYDRLNHVDPEIVFTSQPATKPWGCRAFGFKDPDGNNINFLSPVS